MVSVGIFITEGNVERSQRLTIHVFVLQLTGMYVVVLLLDKCYVWDAKTTSIQMIL